MANNKSDQQTARDEHNDAANAKRTLQVAFNYDKEEYMVIGSGPNGELIIRDERLNNVLNCILEEQRITNRFLEQMASD